MHLFPAWLLGKVMTWSTCMFSICHPWSAQTSRNVKVSELPFGDVLILGRNDGADIIASSASEMESFYAVRLRVDSGWDEANEREYWIEEAKSNENRSRCRQFTRDGGTNTSEWLGGCVGKWVGRKQRRRKKDLTDLNRNFSEPYSDYMRHVERPKARLSRPI